jgi:hypothetical protein
MTRRRLAAIIQHLLLDIFLNLNLIIHLSKSFKLLTPLLRALSSVRFHLNVERITVVTVNRSQFRQTQFPADLTAFLIPNRSSWRPASCLGEPDQFGVLIRAILLKL